MGGQGTNLYRVCVRGVVGEEPAYLVDCASPCGGSPAWEGALSIPLCAAGLGAAPDPPPLPVGPRGPPGGRRFPAPPPGRWRAAPLGGRAPPRPRGGGAFALAVGYSCGTSLTALSDVTTQIFPSSSGSRALLRCASVTGGASLDPQFKVETSSSACIVEARSVRGISIEV